MSRDDPGQELKADLAKATRLEWLSIAYLCSNVIILLIVMAGSQALKTEFVGDSISLIPPTLFLIGNRVSAWPATERYPFGFARAVSAGYFGAALALLATGLFLLGDSALKLIWKEHPIIGGFPLFGQVVWTGWLGIAALLWSSIPAFFLGRAKKAIGKKIHDKVLLADAQINAADWKSAGAAIVGLIGVAWGFWWADAAAALFISIEIVRDGVVEVKSALGDLIDRRPQELDEKKLDPLPERLTTFLQRQDWVEDAVVRIRERGREFSAEAYVVPKSEDDLLTNLANCSDQAFNLDSRLCEVDLIPVRELTPELQEVRADS